MDIYTLTIGISILVYVAIGNYAGRGVKRLDDYYVAGRRAPTLVIIGTLVASLMSATIFLGEAGFAYEGQAGPYVLFPQTATAGYVLGAIFFGRYLRRSRAATVAEFFGRRFESPRVRAMAGITIILALGGYLLAVTQGAAILLSQLSGLNYVQALIVAWVSYTGFTMYSGSRGVILTDTLMFLLFASASFGAIVYIVAGFGGWPAVIEGLVAVEERPELMSWHGTVGDGTPWPTPLDYLVWAMVIDVSWMVVYAVSPWQASRHLMARNEHVVMRAACITCVVVALLQVMIYGLGGVINLSNPYITPPESATIWASLNMLPAWLGAIMLAGIMAAALSSASTFLSLVGFSASSDIGIHDNVDETATLRFSRLMMLVIGAVALVAALVFPPDIFWLMLFIGTVFASSWGPVAIMSVWSKTITEAGAFWGMLSGFVMNVVPKFFEYIGAVVYPPWLDPVVIGAVTSILVIVVVSRFTRPTEQENAYRQMLHRTPPEEIDAGLARTTLWAPAVLIANGVIMPIVLIRWYVRPYQAATGTLLPDGSLDWMTGEAMLALSWSLVNIGLALAARRAIRSGYAPGSSR